MATTNYLYDGMNVIEDMDNGGSIIARYTDTTDADELLSELRSGAASYYEQDGLNSITSLSTPAGALANTYTTDSFGNKTASTGAITNPFQYTGREFDQETGIYEYRSRYYDPAIGRFISEDLIGFEGGLDLYAYVRNRPTRWVDPGGESEQDVERYREAFEAAVKKLNDSGQRFKNNEKYPGFVMDFITFFTPKKKACGQQADFVWNEMQFTKTNVHWEPKWERFYLPPHQRIRLVSQDQNDPDIIIDPWRNNFFTEPKKK